MTLLRLENVHKIFEKDTVNENHVLKGIHLDVNQGDFISIIGGNGAGKSTLLNSISGSVMIDDGKIILDNREIQEDNATKRAGLISRVFQDTKMGTASQLTIEENMAIAKLRGQKRSLLKRAVTEADRTYFKEILSQLDLGLEDRLHVDTQFLSGGQRQALTLIMATLVFPKVLLLDEHTAALDPKTSDMVMQLTNKVVTQRQITTLMITHNMEHAIQYGNRLVMLHQGQIVVDIAGKEKEQLTVSKIMTLFQERSGHALVNDELILM
ncbi:MULTISPECIES: ABC transporter ATP-binding protein [unclassified Granulicatella]|uniref:ABC transporter ATP-binding protein n=1 Tax=unclassified Granulicatella TaxID=2630493 RepID=UPI001074914C|nr:MULTISPECIES: ATP-binding cassette domain-containing protein [unclassified Granulicatella]MBF0780981.1 ATP-binding cassette domain-containing protein [Granulicatella sp. 19428wC4_WM01]TFU92739.1 ATP-binding cassette domain-containing protein [Granulicatella sp. WM01]